MEGRRGEENAFCWKWFTVEPGCLCLWPLTIFSSLLCFDREWLCSLLFECVYVRGVFSFIVVCYSLESAFHLNYLFHKGKLCNSAPALKEIPSIKHFSYSGSNILISPLIFTIAEFPCSFLPAAFSYQFLAFWSVITWYLCFFFSALVRGDFVFLPVIVSFFCFIFSFVFPLFTCKATIFVLSFLFLG